jgi:Ca-activated chloride channel family protein
VALAAAVVSSLLATPAAYADSSAEDEPPPVMVVLDASGSMKEPVSGGGTKMVAAKDAVHTLVEQLPDEASMGLAVYGTATGSSDAEKAAGCKDVKVVHDVGPLDRSALNSAVDGIRPRGYTPIGQSLRTAADALPAEGPRSIVLVSDGEDTCAPPDPCEVAEELAERGVDLRIHAVGFDVDGPARQQLSCVAQVTGGEYVDAKDAGSLEDALERIGRQVLRTYEAVGAPVTGTRQPAGAPTLTPGAYLDRIGPNDTRYYQVDVPAGYTLYATASAISPDDGTDYLMYTSRFSGDTHEDCLDYGSGTKTEGQVTTAALRWTAPDPGSSPRSSPGATPADDPCEKPGVQLIQVKLDAVFDTDQTSALELLIGLEPPVTGDAGPAGTKERADFSPPRGEPKDVVGGGSFSTASTLDGSGAYRDTVLPGETAFYRVHLDWGEGLAYQLRLGKQDYVNGVFVLTAWYSPARAELSSGVTAYYGEETTVPDAGEPLSGPPVRYRNRELKDDLVGRDVSVAGWYYISVLAEHTDSQVPMTIEVSVTGNTHPVPKYDGDGQDPFGEKAGRSRSRASAPEAAAAGFWSNVSDAGPLLWVGIPLVVLIAGGLGGWLLVRRRRFR